MKKFPRSLIYVTGGFLGLAFVIELIVHNFIAAMWVAITFMWFALAIHLRILLERSLGLIDESITLIKNQQNALNQLGEILKTNEPNK